jgi:hypothetical protein
MAQSGSSRNARFDPKPDFLSRVRLQGWHRGTIALKPGWKGEEGRRLGVQG